MDELLGSVKKKTPGDLCECAPRKDSWIRVRGYWTAARGLSMRLWGQAGWALTPDKPPTPLSAWGSLLKSGTYTAPALTERVQGLNE